MQKYQPLVKVVYEPGYDLESWGELKPATDGSAGFDIRACLETDQVIEAGEVFAISSGIKIHINNPRYAAILLPRSGLGVRGLVLANTIGLIDSDYQGVITAVMLNRNVRGQAVVVKPGDKIAQLIFIPVTAPHLLRVSSFDEISERGERGFGHTGL